MRFPLFLAFVVLVLHVGCGAKDPNRPVGGGGCQAPYFNAPCKGSPPPTPSPTPTPTATPTPPPLVLAWPEAPVTAYDGQFGGTGVSAAVVRANDMFPQDTNQRETGVPKAITDCWTNIWLCEPLHYTDPTRVNSAGFPGNCTSTGQAACDFPDTPPVGCDDGTGGVRDNCYMHNPGVPGEPNPSPVPSVDPAGNNADPGDRTTPARSGNLQANNANMCSAGGRAWWNNYNQGVDATIHNTNYNLFWWLEDDTSETWFQHATKLNSTIELTDPGNPLNPDPAVVQAAWEVCLFGFESGQVHATGGPFTAGDHFQIMPNSLQYGQGGTPDGDVSCDVYRCLAQFASANVPMGECEFCPQGGTNGTDGLRLNRTFFLYTLNVASQIDAIGNKIIMLRQTQESGPVKPTNGPTSAPCPSSYPSPCPAPFVTVSLFDRMAYYAQWFYAYDTGPTSPTGAPVATFSCTCPSNGEPISAVMWPDFNNHSQGAMDNTHSLAIFDEVYLVPIGPANIQETPYVPAINPGNGWGRCNSTPGGTDSGGGDDYLIPGTCDNSTTQSLGVYVKCYHKFSYHNVAIAGDICVFTNLSKVDHTIVAGDIPVGYTMAHQYKPEQTCSATFPFPNSDGAFVFVPDCGDAITGGIDPSTQCTGVGASPDIHPACGGNIAAALPGGALIGTVIPKKGGVIVATQ